MEAVPESIPLSVLHEDEHLVVIDKPAGMVVHPAIGHLRGTLVNAVLGRWPDAREPGGEPWRPGVVHRLDAETSGVICLARTAATLAFLQAAWAERRVSKRYLALAAGHPRADWLACDGAIGRHPKDFRRRAVRPLGEGDAKEARTTFVVLHRAAGWTALECRPVTRSASTSPISATPCWPIRSTDAAAPGRCTPRRASQPCAAMRCTPGP